MRVLPTLLALSWGGSAAFAADTWLEIKTPNCAVVSNAGEGTARRTAVEFEQARAAYAKLWPWAKLGQGKLTFLLALKDEGTFKRWAPGYYEVKGGIDVVSGSAWYGDRQYLLVRTDSRPADMSVTPSYNLYRGYLGLLLAGALDRRLPLWLSNGLEDVFGNTSVHDKEILIGRPVPWQLKRYNEGSRLPLQQILDARRDSPLVRKEGQREGFDAQCYVLAHYLSFGDRGAHTAQLGRFIQLWLGGSSQEQAFAESFGGLPALESQLNEYARKSVFSFARFPLDESLEKAPSTARSVAPAEVLGLQASLHVAMDRPVEAQTALRAAREADASSPASYDAEGLLADLDKDKPRAAQAYARAAELGSTSAYTHYRSAQLLWKADADAATLQAMRQRLERAIELNGAYANPRSFLADVLEQQGDGSAALAQAQRAVDLEPGESYHRVSLARALHKLGRNEDARKSADAALRLADDEQDRSSAERFLQFLTEDARHEQDRSQHEAEQKQDNACRSGDTEACRTLLPELEHECSGARAGACAYLAWLYSAAGPLRGDPARSAGYLERACGAGDKHACVQHAWVLARGEGTAKDEAGAVAALDRLCTDGYLPACTRLAFLYVNKPGPADRARARSLLARACEGGDAEACSSVRQLH